MSLSAEERELFVEVGYHIARVMWQNLAESDPSFETEMWDQAESVYEHGCAIMQELGVFRAEGLSAYYFEMPLDDVRDHLSTVSPEISYSFDKIIGEFLWATGYQGDLSPQHEPFEVPGYLQQAMWAFVKLQYATRVSDGFQWSDKIVPIMKAEGMWSEPTRQRPATVDKAQAVKLADRIWAAMPAWRRHLMARWVGGRGDADLYVYLFRRWDGTRLRLFEMPEARLLPLPDGYKITTREIADRLVAIRRGHLF